MPSNDPWATGEFDDLPEWVGDEGVGQTAFEDMNSRIAKAREQYSAFLGGLSGGAGFLGGKVKDVTLKKLKGDIEKWEAQRDIYQSSSQQTSASEELAGEFRQDDTSVTADLPDPDDFKSNVPGGADDLLGDPPPGTETDTGGTEAGEGTEVDAVGGDRVAGDKVPDDEVPDDEVPPGDKEPPGDEVPDDEVPDDEVPGDEEPPGDDGLGGEPPDSETETNEYGDRVSAAIVSLNSYKELLTSDATDAEKGAAFDEMVSMFEAAYGVGSEQVEGLKAQFAASEDPSDIFNNPDFATYLEDLVNAMPSDFEGGESANGLLPGEGPLQRRFREFNENLIAGTVPLSADRQELFDRIKQGMEEGLSPEDRAARERAIERGAQKTLSTGAFAGIAMSSKVLGLVAQQRIEGESQIERDSQAIQERYTDKMAAFQSAVAAENQGKANILLEEAKVELTEYQSLVDQEYADKVFDLKKLETLHNMNLSSAQAEAAIGYQKWQMSMGERSFSAEQKQQMIDNGFTQDQINQAEKDLDSRIDLAEKNWELARRGADLAELKNAQGFGLRERMTALQEELGIREADMNDEKFVHYKQQIEREFGIRLNAQEFQQWFDTKQLNAAIIDMQWDNNRADRQQAQDYMLSKAGLELQEKLGMSQLEVQLVIAGDQIDVAREAQILHLYTTQLGLDFSYEQLYEQTKAQREANQASSLLNVFQVIGSFI